MTMSASTAGPIDAPRVDDDPVLRVRDLAKHFPVRGGLLRRTVARIRAVDGVGFDVAPGETLGLVGESGSGKSTTARLILRLIEPTSGRIEIAGTDVTDLEGADLKRVRRNAQMIFQDPYSSLDPRQRIVEAVGEPLEVHDGLGRDARRTRASELLDRVGLPEEHLDRRPHELSGGQLQRVAVARALATDPTLVVCDEPVSSLDVSTQAQVINLLARLQSELGLSYVFIAHDLSVVRHISHRIAVMYLGQIVEIGDVEDVTERPKHPYTRALLSAIPRPDPARRHERNRIVLHGDLPNPANPPSGCRFHTRCPFVMDVCREQDPPPFMAPSGTAVRCHLHTTGPALAGETVASLPLAPAGNHVHTPAISNNDLSDPDQRQPVAGHPEDGQEHT